MRYILLPIHPEWCEKTLNGDKSIEVRSGTTLYNAINRLIKEQGKAPCLMYCTKGKPYLWEYWFDGDNGCGYCYETSLAKDEYSPKEGHILNGKVVAQFEASAEVICPKEIYGGETFGGLSEVTDMDYETDTLGASELLERSCLIDEQIADYLIDDDTNSPIFGTAIHIHNLKTFDEPKNLFDYGVRKAPQSFMYVEVKE